MRGETPGGRKKQQNTDEEDIPRTEVSPEFSVVNNFPYQGLPNADVKNCQWKKSSLPITLKMVFSRFVRTK